MTQSPTPEKTVNYTEHCELSRVEWEIVKDLRLIMANEYGLLTVKIDGGRVSDVHPTLYRSKSKIRELQK